MTPADARRRARARASTASISTRRGTATRASTRCTRDRYAMRGDPPTHPKDGPTVFATHSTHKLLAALSQTSFIHIRDGRGAIDHGRFNEAYCTQASTSPLYALIASNDVAAAMMDGPAGQVAHAGDDRRGRRLPARGGARAPGIPREEGLVLRARGMRRDSPRPEERQAHPVPRGTSPSSSRRIRAAGCCTRATSWHGFEDMPDGWCMLDPIKFGIVCPGMKDGRQARRRHGIPADIVTAYLGRHGIVPSRTTDHMVLFLFSMGVTKGKWGTLLNTLLDFKADYDRNAPLAEVVPADRRSGAGALCGHGPQGSRRRDVGAAAQEPAGSLAGAGLRHAAEARDDAAPRVPEADGRRRRESPARQDCRPRRGRRRDSVSARHPDRHAGRKHRRRRRPVAHLPAHAAGVRPSIPGLRQGSRRRRRARGAATASIA